MNSAEARIVLGACPPGPWPEEDPMVREALAVAEGDPELTAWLRETRAFDAAVSQRIRTVAPPANLKAAILSGHKAARLLEAEELNLQREAQRWGRGVSTRWFHLSPLAWAAVFLLLLGLGAFWSLGPLNAPTVPEPSGVAAFRRDAAEYLSREWGHDFDYPQESFPRIQEWLAQQKEPVRLTVPAALATARTYGCKVFQWHGHTATLVCFLPGDGGQVVHVVSVNRTDLPTPGVDGLPGPGLQLARAGDWNSAAWDDGRQVHVAFSHASPELLSQWVRTAVQ